MEVYCPDHVALEVYNERKRDIRDLVHREIGLVAGLEISTMPDLETLKLDTGRGCIYTDLNLRVKRLERT